MLFYLLLLFVHVNCQIAESELIKYSRDTIHTPGLRRVLVDLHEMLTASVAKGSGKSTFLQTIPSSAMVGALDDLCLYFPTMITHPQIPFKYDPNHIDAFVDFKEELHSWLQRNLNPSDQNPATPLPQIPIDAKQLRLMTDFLSRVIRWLERMHVSHVRIEIEGLRRQNHLDCRNHLRPIMISSKNKD